MINLKIFRCFLEWGRISPNGSAFGQIINMRYGKSIGRTERCYQFVITSLLSIKDCDWDIGYGEYDFPVEEMVSICDEWLQEFCDQMPLESQRKKYRKVFEIDEE